MRLFDGNDEQLRLTQDGWFYEPSIAEAVVREMIQQEDRIDWRRDCWLDECHLDHTKISAAVLDHSGKAIKVMARTFIDGTYEGDLAAKANVKYRVGREGREEYGESKADIHFPFGALLPKTIDNLLVPVAMSSTHVAMSVLRMEPVWMTTGQVAGLAAARAHELNCDVASLDPTPLPKLLKIQTVQ